MTFRYTGGAPLVPARDGRVLVTRSSLPHPSKGVESRKERKEDGSVSKRRFHAPSSSVVLERVPQCLVDTTSRAAGTWFSRKKSNFHLTAFISPPPLPQLFLFIEGTPHFSPIERLEGDRVPTSKRGRLIIGLSAFLTPHPPPLLPPPHPNVARGRLYPIKEEFYFCNSSTIGCRDQAIIGYRSAFLKKKKKNPFVKRLLERCVIEGSWLGFQARNRRWEHVDVS